MSVQVRRRRESAAYLQTYVGAQGELLVDTSNNRVQVHDGTTSGGWPAAGIGDLPGRNALLNGTFAVNQRGYAGGTLAANAYAHDRWKVGANGGSYTFAQGVPDTIVTITAGTLVQAVDAPNLYAGAYWLTWAGTATARVWQGAAAGVFSAGMKVPAGGVTVNALLVPGLALGTIANVEFSTGTLGLVQLEAALPNAGPTRFKRRHGETTLCQRYFQRWAQPPLRGASSGGTSAARLGMVLPVFMRAAPTLTMSGNLGLLVPAVAQGTLASINTNYSTSTTCELDGTSAAPMGSPGQCLAVFQGGSSYLDISAEL